MTIKQSGYHINDINQEFKTITERYIDIRYKVYIIMTTTIGMNSNYRKFGTNISNVTRNVFSAHY